MLEGALDEDDDAPEEVADGETSDEGAGADADADDADAPGDEDDAPDGAAPGASGGGAAALSAHERRLARMAARIARMEEANMGEREWFLRGEAGAGARPPPGPVMHSAGAPRASARRASAHRRGRPRAVAGACTCARACRPARGPAACSRWRGRFRAGYPTLPHPTLRCGRAGARPLNSALEVDLDFERAARPPPAPTEAATASLEDLIRRRCAERAWDDPSRAAPPAPAPRRRELELDDRRSAKARARAARPAAWGPPRRAAPPAPAPRPRRPGPGRRGSAGMHDVGSCAAPAPS